MRDVIILGNGPSKFECPYDTETWGVNAVVHYAEDVGRLDKLFFFDDLDTFNPRVMRLDNLLETKAELVTTEKNVEFLKKYKRNAVVFPIDEIIKRYKTAYFSNSISYMIVYAMYLGDIKFMSLYGVDHTSWDSYVKDRPGVEYWVGRAEQSGIGVYIARASALCKTDSGGMYGYVSTNKYMPPKEYRMFLDKGQREEILTV